MVSLRPEQGLFSLGMPISHETILRQVKRRSRASKPVNLIRVVGVDYWAWRKDHVFVFCAALSAASPGRSRSRANPCGRALIGRVVTPSAVRRASVAFRR